MTFLLQNTEYGEFVPKGILSKNFDVDVLFLEKPSTRSAKPPKFSVSLYKSHDTETDFILQILSTVFHKTKEEMKDILSQIEEKGSGVVGFYTKEIAETKIKVVRKLVELRQSSLECKMQKE